MGQRMSDNPLTGHHVWDRVCEQRGGQTQPTDRIGMRTGRVESSSRAERSQDERSVEPNSRTAEQSNRSEHSAKWSQVTGQRRLQ